LTQKPCGICGGDAVIPGPQQVSELAASIPLSPSLCAAADVYAARLDQCRCCNDLREGVLCAWCGCYVQFRARPKAGYCPNPEGDRWKETFL
jgi:hypothetical protein